MPEGIGPARPAQAATSAAPSPLDRLVVSPILVGRDAHLAALEDLLARVHGGAGRTVLVAGEAGIGKSRLVAEVRVRAERLGFLCLSGQCFESDRVLPYAPFLDLLRARSAGRTAEDVARELGTDAPELAVLLPELSALSPGAAPWAPPEPERDRRRVVHALARFVAGLATTRPMLVIVEDLHWSDDASLEVVLDLARRAAARPLLPLLTYRTDELHPALPHVLAELDRGRLATELTLARLAPDEVDAMLRAIFAQDRPIRAEFLAALYALTEGNPFFVEEVLRTLLAAGDIFYAEGLWDRKPLPELRIPRSVRDAVRRRVARLGEADQRVLALAAVAGRRFDFALLQELSGLEEDALVRIVKGLIDAQLVVEESAERFAFRHALTRQAVYADLLVRERQAWHGRVAAALERRSASSEARVEDLAYHFFEAAAWAKALDYAARAGERARALDAPRAAVEQFGRALEAARQSALVPPAALHRGRGLAYETLGDFEAARADHEAAFRLARATGDRPGEWRALLDLGFLWTGRDFGRAQDDLQHALDLARQIGDPATLAHSLNHIGNWHLNAERADEARRLHEEALATFRQVDDSRGVAATLDLLGVTSFLSGDLAQSRAYYEEAVARFRAAGDRRGLAGSLATLTLLGTHAYTDTLAPAWQSPDDAVHRGEEALRIAGEIGWRSREAFILCALGLCLAAHGDYGRALASLRRGLALAEELEHREVTTFALCALGALYRDLQALPAARHHLERGLALAEELGSRHWIRNAAGALATACVAQHDLTRAEDVLAAAPEAEALPQTLGQRVVWAARAELALAHGDPPAAMRIVDRLSAPAPGVSLALAVPRLAHLRGEALAALGQSAEAEATLRAAQRAAEAWGVGPRGWQIDLALGRLYRGRGDHDAADHACAAARRTIEGLAAAVPDDALRNQFLRGATALVPRRDARTSRHAAPAAFGGLTPREREVAALLAQGKSNREVAAALFVGERTVETHVSHILAKFGWASRAQAAAWLRETGRDAGAS